MELFQDVRRVQETFCASLDYVRVHERTLVCADVALARFWFHVRNSCVSRDTVADSLMRLADPTSANAPLAVPHRVRALPSTHERARKRRRVLGPLDDSVGASFTDGAHDENAGNGNNALAAPCREREPAHDKALGEKEKEKSTKRMSGTTAEEVDQYARVYAILNMRILQRRVIGQFVPSQHRVEYLQDLPKRIVPCGPIKKRRHDAFTRTLCYTAEGLGALLQGVAARTRSVDAPMAHLARALLTANEATRWIDGVAERLSSGPVVSTQPRLFADIEWLSLSESHNAINDAAFGTASARKPVQPDRVVSPAPRAIVPRQQHDDDPTAVDVPPGSSSGIVTRDRGGSVSSSTREGCAKRTRQKPNARDASQVAKHTAQQTTHGTSVPVLDLGSPPAKPHLPLLPKAETAVAAQACAPRQRVPMQQARTSPATTPVLPPKGQSGRLLAIAPASTGPNAAPAVLPSKEKATQTLQASSLCFCVGTITLVSLLTFALGLCAGRTLAPALRRLLEQRGWRFIVDYDAVANVRVIVTDVARLLVSIVNVMEQEGMDTQDMRAFCSSAKCERMCRSYGITPPAIPAKPLPTSGLVHVGALV